MKGYALSVGLDVVASHSFFVGSGGWVGNMGRAGYGQCPNRRASSKLGFLGVLGEVRARPGAYARLAGGCLRLFQTLLLWHGKVCMLDKARAVVA